MIDVDVPCHAAQVGSGPLQNGDQLVAVAGSDALGSAEEVTFERTFRHGEPVGDLLVRESLCGKQYDFALTGRERLRRRCGP